MFVDTEIESSKEQHLFEREIAFFEQFNVSLLNKIINLLKNNKLLNCSVYSFNFKTFSENCIFHDRGTVHNIHSKCNHKYFKSFCIEIMSLHFSDSTFICFKSSD